MLHRVTSLDDPRLHAYRNLPERAVRGENCFITEGQLVTHRLLQSDYEAESLFVTESYANEFEAATKGKIPIYVATPAMMSSVVGFRFHRGVLGVGRRPVERRLDAFSSRLEKPGRLRLVVCPNVKLSENMGLIFRTAAGFNVDGILVGPTACDPLSRRAIRLSMGGVLRIPFFRSTEITADLEALRRRWGVTLFATVLDESAEPLPTVEWSERAAMLFGNEFEGLDDECLACCDRKVTIPMPPWVDSLNLGVAAGIFVYEMMKSTLPDIEKSC